MQTRWKTAKQREVQDQVGSEGRMRSRQMRQERAPEEDEVRKDWILERSAAVVAEDDRPENWKYDRNMESERSAWRFFWDSGSLSSESPSESEMGGWGWRWSIGDGISLIFRQVIKEILFYYFFCVEALKKRELREVRLRTPPVCFEKASAAVFDSAIPHV
ncbi:hypothetical protein TIFTF001_010522 [Ficus carica]|uniref:Uncharacterized protein n=1 Tax=Ficus carica TaxID=3494 RepID=A0AA87ZVM7_FICCA|nr:hypothetical protein TIFTF001_010522 [Ficus carica]